MGVNAHDYIACGIVYGHIPARSLFLFRVFGYDNISVFVKVTVSELLEYFRCTVGGCAVDKYDFGEIFGVSLF